MRLKMDALTRENEMKNRYTREAQEIDELQKELHIKTSQLNRISAHVKIYNLIFFF